MPVIVIASPKGGSGKSTAAILLGTELADAGAEVVLLDCDPNRSVTLWASKAVMPPRIRLLSDIGESDIIRTIKVHDTDGRIVICDLEGVASRLVSPGNFPSRFSANTDACHCFGRDSRCARDNVGC